MICFLFIIIFSWFGYQSGVGDSSQQLRSENENARQLKNPVPPNFAKYSQIVQSNASTNNNAVVRSSKDSMDGQQILGSGANSSNSTIPTVTASPAPFNISGRGVEIGKATSSVHCDPTCSQSEGDMESSLYPTDSESYFPYSGPPLPQQQQQQKEQLQQSEGMHELSLQQRGGVDGFVTDMSSCPSDLFDNNSTTAAAMNGKSLNVSKPARGKKPITPDVSGRTVAAFDERNSYVGVASFESQSIGMQRSTSTGAMHTQIEQAADNQPMLSSSSQPRDSSSQFLARLAAQSSSSAIVKPKPAKRRVSESKLGVSSGIPNAISIEVQQQEQRQQQQQQNSGVPFADGSQIRASSGVQSAELKRTSLLYQHNQLQLQHSRCFTVESGSNRDDSSQKPRTVSVLHRDLLLKDSLSSAVAARQRNLVHPASVGRTDTEATTAVSAFAIRQQHQQQQQSFMHTVGHPLSDETDEERSLTDDVEAGTEKRRVRAITDRRSALLARLHELQTSKHTSRSVPPTSFLICSRKVLGSQKTKTDAKTPSSALTLTDISFESHDNTDAESFEEVLPIAESVHLTDRVFSKPKSHWDYLLEEAQWLAVDFKQELRWKLAASKAVAQTCCLRAPRLLPPEKKRKFGIPKFVADSVLTESVGAAAASASKDIVQSSERDTSRPSSTSKLGPDAEIDAVGTVRGSVQMEIESPGAACKVLVASAPDDTVINPATAPVAAASLVTSAEQSDGCDYRRAVAGKISQSVEEFWRELHTDCAGAHVAEGVSLRPLWDMRELFEGPSANSALRSVMPQLQTDLARVCSTLETATAHSDVHEVVKKLISLSPDRIGSEIGDSGRSYLLQHQKESFDRVCSLNASQFGAFLYGPQFAGKSILSMMLLNRWIGEQVHGDASGGPLPIALVFTFRQRELKWLNHWEQLTSPKDGESKATNLKAVVPMLWSDIQSDETRLKCAEEGLGASVLIVAFEDYDNFFGHFLVEGKEEMGAKMSSSHLLLGRACGIIVDGCFTDLIGRDTSLYFADGAVVRCSGTSESVSADFPSAPMRAVSCVAIVLELLAKHTPAQMRNRCLLSAHSLFSDCFDFFSALAFLSPGQSRSAWRRHFSHARKGAAIADAVAVASIKNVIDEIGCGGTETFSFGTLKIGQENRNILSQIATNLSAVIDLPRPSSVKEVRVRRA